MLSFSKPNNKSKVIDVVWHEGILTAHEKEGILDVFVSGMSHIRSYKPCESLESEGLRVISIVEESRAHLLKAKVDGDIVGFALFTPLIDLSNERQQRVSLFVTSYQKNELGERVYTGVGSAMRQFVLKFYKDSGITLVGNVKRENTLARNLYQRWGVSELAAGQTYNNQDPKISIGLNYTFPKR